MTRRREANQRRHRCKNKVCNEVMTMDRHRFCASCRAMGRRARLRFFPIAAIIGGLLWGALERWVL